MVLRNQIYSLVLASESTLREPTMRPKLASRLAGPPATTTAAAAPAAAAAASASLLTAGDLEGGGEEQHGQQQRGQERLSINDSGIRGAYSNSSLYS